MNKDLISRQAAINLLRKRLIETANNNVGFKCDAGEVFEDVSDRIICWFDELPSAQPEHTEMHSCDCERRETHEWIPVTEALPDRGKTVLITNDKGNVRSGRFRGVEFWKDDGDAYWTFKGNTVEHVLAWMPLPEPWREQDGME